jgi:hypothetical protein
VDLDAVKFALLVGGPMFALHLVGIVEGMLLSHWLKTRRK